MLGSTFENLESDLRHSGPDSNTCSPPAGNGAVIAMKAGESAHTPLDFYQMFLDELCSLTVKPVTLDELVAMTALHKSQISEWLKRAVDDGHIVKFNHPVRYQCVDNKE
ncbi:hypothetical protein [Sodalis sp. dw_96]|uniref:hypothetical protein n=1 Tax=Sodalis sp. dw_96 TaxID=2719794 RepID=UPI001BD2725C|nr:hypothetical protein [Sodalis sp. dw_96]